MDKQIMFCATEGVDANGGVVCTCRQCIRRVVVCLLALRPRNVSYSILVRIRRQRGKGGTCSFVTIK